VKRRPVPDEKRRYLLMGCIPPDYKLSPSAVFKRVNTIPLCVGDAAGIVRAAAAASCGVMLIDLAEQPVVDGEGFVDADTKRI